MAPKKRGTANKEPRGTAQPNLAAFAKAAPAPVAPEGLGMPVVPAGHDAKPVEDKQSPTTQPAGARPVQNDSPTDFRKGGVDGKLQSWAIVADEFRRFKFSGTWDEQVEAFKHTVMLMLDGTAEDVEALRHFVDQWDVAATFSEGFMQEVVAEGLRLALCQATDQLQSQQEMEAGPVEEDSYDGTAKRRRKATALQLTLLGEPVSDRWQQHAERSEYDDDKERVMVMLGDDGPWIPLSEYRLFPDCIANQRRWRALEGHRERCGDMLRETKNMLELPLRPGVAGRCIVRKLHEERMQVGEQAQGEQNRLAAPEQPTGEPPKQEECEPAKEMCDVNDVGGQAPNPTTPPEPLQSLHAAFKRLADGFSLSHDTTDSLADAVMNLLTDDAAVQALREFLGSLGDVMGEWDEPDRKIAVEEAFSNAFFKAAPAGHPSNPHGAKNEAQADEADVGGEAQEPAGSAAGQSEPEAPEAPNHAAGLAGNTLVKHKSERLVACNFFLRRATPEGSNIKEICKIVEAVRGQRWRIISLTFRCKDSQGLARSLAAYLPDPCLVAVASTNAYAVYKAPDHNSSLKFKVYPDMQLLTENLTVEHWGFLTSGNINQHLLEVLKALPKEAEWLAGSMRVETSGSDEVLEFEDACELLKDTKPAEYLALKANAKRAKTLGDMTALQRSILCYGPELQDWVKMQGEAASMCISRDMPGLKDWKDFPEEFRKSPMWTYNAAEGVIAHGELEKDYVNSREHLRRSIFFVGVAEAGKSLVLHALGRMFARRYRKSSYVFGKSIDPMGQLTRSGQMAGQAAICLTDLDLVSLMNSRLTVEHVKGLLQVYEPTHCPGRYHQIIITAYTPKCFAVNCDRLDDGTLDLGSWFRRQGLVGLVALAQQDVEALKAMSEDEIAMARRVWICPVYSSAGVNMEDMDALLDKMVQDGIDAEAELAA